MNGNGVNKEQSLRKKCPVCGAGIFFGGLRRAPFMAADAKHAKWYEYVEQPWICKSCGSRLSATGAGALRALSFLTPVVVIAAGRLWGHYAIAAVAFIAVAVWLLLARRLEYRVETKAN